MKLSTIASLYADKLNALGDTLAAAATINELNHRVMQLPFAEAHLALSGKKADALPVLGDGVTLEEYVKLNFFAVVRATERQAFEMTQPVLVAGSHLVALNQWQEWKTLEAYLFTMRLQPCIIFRNKPLRAGLYVADCRVLFLESA